MSGKKVLTNTLWGYSKHLAGMRNKRLSEKYSLSESSIRRIVLKQSKALVTAMVDRLTHKAILLNMTGKSYRMKETQEMMNQQI